MKMLREALQSSHDQTASNVAGTGAVGNNFQNIDAYAEAARESNVVDGQQLPEGADIDI